MNRPHRSRSYKEDIYDICDLNRNSTPIENFIQIFASLCQDDGITDKKVHVAYLNVIVDLSDQLNVYEDLELIFFSVYSIVKFSLWNDCRIIRNSALRCLRYYLHNIDHMKWFLHMRLDFLIMRCLDLSYEDAMNCKYRSNEDAERIQCLRLIYKLSLISPQLFPFSLVSMLCGICINPTLTPYNPNNLSSGPNQNVSGLDLAIKPALMILCQLVTLRPSLSYAPDVLPALQSVICPNSESKHLQELNFRVIEAVLLTQLKLASQLPWRSSIPCGYFHKLLAPFCSYNPNNSSKFNLKSYIPYDDGNNLYDTIFIQIASCFLHSWSGILYFMNSENKPIVTLLKMLDVGDSLLKNKILDLIYSLFNIPKPPNPCIDFPSGLRSLIDQTNPINSPEWCVDSDFLVGQAGYCLSYLSSSRVNLVDNCQAVLLGCLIQNGLLDNLAAAVADSECSVRAGILLGCLIYRTSVLLPSDHPSISHRTDPDELLSNPQCTEAIHWICKMHQILESGPQYLANTNPYLISILQQHPIDLSAHHTTSAPTSSSNYANGTTATSSSTINLRPASFVDGGSSDNLAPFPCQRFLQPDNIEDIIDSAFYLPMTSGTPLSAITKRNLSLSSASDYKPGNKKFVSLMDHVIRYSRIYDSINTQTSSSRAFYDIWDWDLILLWTNSLNQSSNPSNFDKEQFIKTIRIILNFLVGLFPPRASQIDTTKLDPASTHTFISLPITWKHANKAVFVFADLIVFLMESSKNELSEDFTNLLEYFRENLVGSLHSNIDEEFWPLVQSELDNLPVNVNHQQYLHETILVDYELNYKCSGYLFLVFGKLTATDHGEETLERFSIVQLYRLLLMYADKSRSSIVLPKLILASLDYTRPAIGRTLLSIAATSNSVDVRRYTTKFMRVLLRARVPFFSSWGIAVLVKQLCDSDRQVFDDAMDILLEACEDESVINNLSCESMNILHKGYNGYILFSRMLSLPNHFEYFLDKNSLNMFLDKWNELYNVEYCRRFDESLLRYFTNYEPEINVNENPDENRSSNRPRNRTRELILPCHPYGSIAEHKQGLEYLLTNGYLQSSMEMITCEWHELHRNCCGNVMNPNGPLASTCCNNPAHKDFSSLDSAELQLRSCMLCVCHVASTIWGLEWATEVDLHIIISDLARLHPSFNVRGTALICLGLLGSTRRGVTLLNRTGLWSGLRSDRRQKWPLLLDVYHQWQQARAELRRQLWHETSAGSHLNHSSTLLPEDINEFPSAHVSGAIGGGMVYNSAFLLLQSASSVGYSVFAANPHLQDRSKNSRTPADNLDETQEDTVDGSNDEDPPKTEIISPEEDSNNKFKNNTRKITIDHEMNEEELHSICDMLEYEQTSFSYSQSQKDLLSRPVNKFHSKSLDNPSDANSASARNKRLSVTTAVNSIGKCAKSRTTTYNGPWSHNPSGISDKNIYMPTGSYWPIINVTHKHLHDDTVSSSSSHTNISSNTTANPSPKISSAAVFNPSAITPYDVMGIATIRRLQKKISRPNIFSGLRKNSRNKSEEDLIIFRTPRKNSLSNKNNSDHTNIHSASKPKKKLSSMINPQGLLNKYRGLVVPTDFNDFTQKCDDEYLTSHSTTAAESLSCSTKLDSTDRKLLLHQYSLDKGNLNFHNESSKNSCGLYDTGTSEDNSLHRALFDIDTLTMEPGIIDHSKSIRSSSDQDRSNSSAQQKLGVKPRAYTVGTMISHDSTDDDAAAACHEHASASATQHSHRNISVFLGEQLLPPRHDETSALIYHRSSFCLLYNCTDEDSSCGSSSSNSSVRQFRSSVLQVVNNILVLGPKSHKLELNLARLKSSTNQHELWADCCLYTELCCLFVHYNFSKEARQFIQELFMAVPMLSLHQEMKYFLVKLSEKYQIDCSISTKL